MVSLQLAITAYIVTIIFALLVATVFKGLASLIKKLGFDKDESEIPEITNPEDPLARVAAITAAIHVYKGKK